MRALALLVQGGFNCFESVYMLTRLKLKREGKLVGTGSQVGARRRRAQFPQSTPQDSPPVVVEYSVSMSHEGGNDSMIEDEKDFRKDLFDMT